MLTCWRKKELPAQALPLPYEVCIALIGCALSCQDLGLAAGFAVAFHCFLRTAELVNLTGSDVVLSKTHGVVCLATTKKGFRDVVRITCPLTLSLCTARLSQICPGDSFLGVSSKQCTQCFFELLAFLGLSHMGFRFYSFRRGGATYFFKKTGNLDETVLRGRWESTRTARIIYIYITDGMAQLASLAIPMDSQKAISQYARVLQRYSIYIFWPYCYILDFVFPHMFFLSFIFSFSL